MFHGIPPEIAKQMGRLVKLDAKDRQDGTPRMVRLRQIPPETGKFIALLAAAAPPGDYLEIGTSAGYSTLWLALAARSTGRTITTYEILPMKIQLATETFDLAQAWDVIKLVHGDALKHMASHDGLSFCFLDAEKEVYGGCYDLVIPKLVSGGLLVADNAINHRETLQPMIDKALADPRVDAMVVPIGKGELVCRKI